MDIENNSTDNYFGMSLFSITNFIKAKKQNEDSSGMNEDDIILDYLGNILLKNIHKTSIRFKTLKKDDIIKENKYI